MRLLFYTMHPMSFREFLSYESILDKDPIPLEDILANHHDLVKEINAEMNIVPIYRNYLEHGCYPFIGKTRICIISVCKN